MPKILNNPEERLKEEARRQLREEGFRALTVRSVAAGCGVGVGTVYNYFSSKDDLVAACMLDDWRPCREAILRTAEEEEGPESLCRCICRQLLSFSQSHQAIFRESGALASFERSFPRYHGLLCAQLAEPLRRYCPDDFTAEFTADALLTWTSRRKSFEELYPLLEKNFI